jgi:hypothetical protein
MTLILDYNSLTAGIVNYLAANSATLDANMTASVTAILAFRPDEQSKWTSQLPCISVDLTSHEEERLELGTGANSRRKITCNWDIGCHTRLVSSYTAVVNEARTLVSNVEYALRLDDTLSGTVNMVEIGGAEFGNIIRGKNGFFQKNGLINMVTVTELT